MGDIVLIGRHFAESLRWLQDCQCERSECGLFIGLPKETDRGLEFPITSNACTVCGAPYRLSIGRAVDCAVIKDVS